MDFFFLFSLMDADVYVYKWTYCILNVLELNRGLTFFWRRLLWQGSYLQAENGCICQMNKILNNKTCNTIIYLILPPIFRGLKKKERKYHAFPSIKNIVQ